MQTNNTLPSYKHFNWKAIGFDFGNWEEEKIWALDLPTEQIDITELEWHLDIPYWENDAEERWTVAPRDVIEKRENTLREQTRVDQADTTYPIDLFRHDGKLFVLDGLHRFVKLSLQGHTQVAVRIIPPERFPDIASEHPFELPQ